MIRDVYVTHVYTRLQEEEAVAVVGDVNAAAKERQAEADIMANAAHAHQVSLAMQGEKAAQKAGPGRSWDQAPTLKKRKKQQQPSKVGVCVCMRLCMYVCMQRLRKGRSSSSLARLVFAYVCACVCMYVCMQLLRKGRSSSSLARLVFVYVCWLCACMHDICKTMHVISSCVDTA
jgi:hypothetical protein